jgi:hypothetical protein
VKALTVSGTLLFQYFALRLLSLDCSGNLYHPGLLLSATDSALLRFLIPFKCTLKAIPEEHERNANQKNEDGNHRT